jgi:hypothetical protein
MECLPGGNDGDDDVVRLPLRTDRLHGVVRERLANAPLHATVTMALAASGPTVDDIVRNAFAAAGARPISLADFAFYTIWEFAPEDILGYVGI